MSGLPLETAGRLGLLVPLAIALVAFLFVVHLEFSSFPNLANEIDEYYFSACAVRGLDLGAIPVSGCQDNKGPLIYFVYEMIFLLAGIYNYVAIKCVAIALLLLNIALLARIALRLSGIAAAMMTATLLLLCVTSDITYVALKTESVGGLFLTLALLVLSVPQAFKSHIRLVLSGLLIGIAVVAKQPYAFAGFAVIAWLFLVEPVRSLSRLFAFLARGTLFGVFVLVPFLIFWLVFAFQGSATDYLTSFFLYPSVYGSSRGDGFANLIRHLATVSAGLKDQVLLVVMTAGAAGLFIFSEPSPKPVPNRFSGPRWLFILVIVFLLAALVASPVWFAYYIVFVAGPMALLSGIVFGDYWERARRASPQMTFAFLTALTVGAMTATAETWHSNARKDDSLIPARTMGARAGGHARYAYQLGEQPDLYAAGGYVPASSIQFSWALPGTPERWSYKRPPANTLTRRLLDDHQARNLAQLYADFARTPPSAILLQSDHVRAADSPNAVDIPGFQDYLDRNCKLAQRTELRAPISTSLYDCGKNRDAPIASLRSGASR